MFAVIKTGGKQYKVAPGDRIKIEKIEGEDGSEVKFSEVLLTSIESEMKVGAPYVKGAEVTGKIIKTAKGKKVTGVKFKAKKRYKVKFGHRQIMTEVEILKIAG
jgi:large subunit ribosomal protein L21